MAPSNITDPFLKCGRLMSCPEFDAWYAENFLPPEPTPDAATPTSPDQKMETLPKVTSVPIVSDKDLQFL